MSVCADPSMPRASRLKPHFLIALCIALLAMWSPSEAAAVNPSDTRLVGDPAISESHVVFVYDGDLWVASREGGSARRLTSDVGDEFAPRISPDGKSVAFSGQYDGNIDVFVIPIAGGAPERRTWHPSPDVVQGFDSEGNILFISRRELQTFRFTQLYRVPVDSGFPQLVPLPSAASGAETSDGSLIAYNPLREVFRQWKGYRGGTHSRIWVYDTADASVVQVPQPSGEDAPTEANPPGSLPTEEVALAATRSNDIEPMWIDGVLYFLSDRAGELNLFSWDPSTGSVEQRTEHQDFPVLEASSGAGVVIYEQAGYLHVFDPAANSSRRVAVGAASDLVERRPRYVTGLEWVGTVSLSPSGARLAAGMRGNIATVPVEKGSPRWLAEDSGSHERHPSWSPDGRRVAFFTDQEGEYTLKVVNSDGSGGERTYPLQGVGMYLGAEYSPDGKTIAYMDQSWALYLLDVESGKITAVAEQLIYGPGAPMTFHWSPDSRWITYSRLNASHLQQVMLYEVATGQSTPVSDELTDSGDPVFDASGDYLYFTTALDAGPVRQWFAQSNSDMRTTNQLQLAILAADGENPFAPESDEEAKAEEKKAEGEKPDAAADSKNKGSGSDKDGSGDGEEGGVTPITVDLEGLDQRILALPTPPGGYTQLQAGNAGQLYYLRNDEGSTFEDGITGTRLVRFSLDSGEEQVLLASAQFFDLSADRNKLLAFNGQAVVVGAAGPLDAGKGRVAVDKIPIRVDPPAEWEQIYNEGWRINRDYFYDPNLHGVDWQEERDRYAEFLPHLASRDDLNRVTQWLFSELAVGHHFSGGGDERLEAESVRVGLLGADWEAADGRYRIARVLPTTNWDPRARSPLAAPGVDAKAGEYLLAVNGRDLSLPENLFSRFDHTVGQQVELTLASSADGADSRIVTVVPIRGEVALRYRTWVEDNRRRVSEATDGRIAYVHVPDTARDGYDAFKRYFYPQVDREGLILDERYNGGGLVADYYIDILRRSYISNWAQNFGKDLQSPVGMIEGPKVMVIDENAGSGGDLLPWMFRNFELGTLVGRPTWGGLVGIFGTPNLVDGGFTTAPNIGIWTEDGFVVENIGVAPDVEVEQLPKDWQQGRDSQLERAIAIALEELEANPVPERQRPPFPLRAQQ
ncbi:MAG: PDZ domain-containing protein [Acidobacteriota bacterium]